MMHEIAQDDIVCLDDVTPYVVFGLPLSPSLPGKTGVFRALLGADWYISPRYAPYEAQDGSICILALFDSEADFGSKLTWCLSLRKLHTPLSLQSCGTTLQEAVNNLCLELDKLSDAVSAMQLQLLGHQFSRV